MGVELSSERSYIGGRFAPGLQSFVKTAGQVITFFVMTFRDAPNS